MTKKELLLLIGLTGLAFAEFYYMKDFSVSLYGPPNISKGELAFNVNCAACHGEKGLGDGIMSKAIAIKPDNIYQELTDPFSFKAELINSVLDGDISQDGVMPAFRGALTVEQINDIFGYIVHINEAES
ncbi:c-type cytochrome [Neptuniibacter sp. QD72_48]|uniref:c-type cytochrome n=1 Tax=unclassified Neptuniibacter TaxID=2630693 RepID=UPI0039F4E1AF